MRDSFTVEVERGAQRAALASHCGAARFAFNWGLGLVKQRMEARAAGQEVRLG